MKKQLEAFVNQRLPLPGLLAWGAALPDTSFHSHGYQDGFQSSQIHEFLKRIDGLSRNLIPAGREGARFCWTFQLVRIYAISCAQGASLMLCLRNEQRGPTDTMSNVLNDFQQLQWVQEASESEMVQEQPAPAEA